MENFDPMGDQDMPELQNTTSLMLVGEGLSAAEVAEELEYAERESTPTLLKRMLSPDGDNGGSLEDVAEELEGLSTSPPPIHQIFSPGIVGPGVSPEEIMEELESDNASEIEQLFARGGESSEDLVEELGFLATCVANSPRGFLLSGIGSSVTVVVSDSGDGPVPQQHTVSTYDDLTTTEACRPKHPTTLKVVGKIVHSDPVFTQTVTLEGKAESEPIIDELGEGKAESETIIEELESTLTLSNEDSESAPCCADPTPSRGKRVIVGKHTAPRKPGAPYLSPRKVTKTQPKRVKSQPKIWQPWKN